MLQHKVYGGNKAASTVSKRMGQSSNGPIKQLGHINSGVKRLGHSSSSNGGKNNLNSEMYPRY
jgi:hypothetical protein